MTHLAMPLEKEKKMHAEQFFILSAHFDRKQNGVWPITENLLPNEK